jgi:hypothetical protein
MLGFKTSVVMACKDEKGLLSLDGNVQHTSGEKPQS